MPPSTAAQDPTDIPAKGWKDIAIGVKDSLTTDHVGLIAAGVAFYALLAIFPMISALMALAGLVLDPAQVTSQLASLTGLLPEEAGKIILKQAQSVAGAGNTGLGLTFIIGLILAIYSASKGMGSLIEGLNVAYGVDEGRGFVNKLAVTLALTLFLIFGLVLGLTAAVLAPAVLSFVALPDWLETTLSL
jgi:membrane protein